jgi:N-acetylmuramic acid 6-phosphate etherase
MGMTPIETARNEEVPGSGVNFDHVARDLEHHDSDRFYPLIIEVGPEVVQGSSRLKGGSATWIALHGFLTAVRDGVKPSELILKELDRIRDAKVSPTLPEVIERAGDVIRKGGDLVYVAEGEVADAASLDASECSPTFGIEKERVRVVRADTAELGGAVVRPTDLVIYLGDADSAGSLANRSGAQHVRVPATDFITAKMCVLNQISTGAFTRAGFVYGNRMINVRPSNSKLYDRALEIIVTIAGVSREEAHRSMVASIVGSNEPTPEDLSLSKAELCVLAGKRSEVVPLAIARANGLSLSEGRRLLESGIPLRKQGETPSLGESGD